MIILDPYHSPQSSEALSRPSPSRPQKPKANMSWTDSDIANAATVYVGGNTWALKLRGGNGDTIATASGGPFNKPVFNMCRPNPPPMQQSTHHTTYVYGCPPPCCPPPSCPPPCCLPLCCPHGHPYACPYGCVRR
jgi:hypothetical protein